MKIAIYGGSFNPMHIGHEKIVDYVLKNLDMDKIIIIPVGIPSHRENNLEQSDTRLKICKEIFSKINYDENIFYTIIAYLTKFRDNYSIYMEVDENNLNFDMKNYSDDKKIYLNIFEKVLNKYKLKNVNKFRASLYKYFEKDFTLNQDLKNILMEKMIWK